MSLHLYHHNSSVCAAKVRVALAEKSLDWDGTELTLEGDQLSERYRRLNPGAVVPTLVHDAVVVIESNVILEYLEDAFAELPLRPDHAADRAAMRLLLHALEGEAGIHHATSVLTYAVAYRHRLIDEAGGLEPALMEPVIRRRMNARSRAWLEDAIYRGTASGAFLRALRTVDALLEGFEARLGAIAWLAGERYSLADVAYTPYLVRFDLLGLRALFDGRPALRSWYERLCSRDSAAEVLDRYRPEYRRMLEERGAEVTATLPELLRRAKATT